MKFISIHYASFTFFISISFSWHKRPFYVFMLSPSSFMLHFLFIVTLNKHCKWSKNNLGSSLCTFHTITFPPPPSRLITWEDQGTRQGRSIVTYSRSEALKGEQSHRSVPHPAVDPKAGLLDPDHRRRPRPADGFRRREGLDLYQTRPRHPHDVGFSPHREGGGCQHPAQERESSWTVCRLGPLFWTGRIRLAEAFRPPAASLGLGSHPPRCVWPIERLRPVQLGTPFVWSLQTVIGRVKRHPTRSKPRDRRLSIVLSIHREAAKVRWLV